VLAADHQLARVHPQRLFYPGQTYRPEELTQGEAAVFQHRPSHKTRQLYKRSHAANAALFAEADFRAGRLLAGFTSDQGKLLPRRTNKVDAKVQSRIVRAIKTARMLALLPYSRDSRPRGTGGASMR
jgi:ribosomal protein S18